MILEHSTSSKSASKFELKIIVGKFFSFNNFNNSKFKESGNIRFDTTIKNVCSTTNLHTSLKESAYIIITSRL